VPHLIVHTESVIIRQVILPVGETELAYQPFVLRIGCVLEFALVVMSCWFPGLSGTTPMP
jgi:hypothetical protein